MARGLAPAHSMLAGSQRLQPAAHCCARPEAHNSIEVCVPSVVAAARRHILDAKVITPAATDNKT